MSPIGIATVVLTNRKNDNKAGDSGAAGQWLTPWSSRCQVKKFLSSRTFVSPPLSNMSPIGIATVVLPNRKTDNKAGGSGAAGHCSGSGAANSMVQQVQGNM